ncbi:MAG TPA: acetylglutamate kinase [Polyangiaceae bacterium]|jgi:acetylglutamate kinase|nr:acetylglutamate kinase [Polyangiaceae bacterium]
MNELVAKAAILHEALPYIRRFHNRTFVVKYGGHAMVDDALKESFARDVCLLRYVGIRVVVVHGGGPQIDEMLDRVGIKATFAGGLRVTDDATMNMVEMVLTGNVNADIVGLICAQGGRAMGISGRDDNMLLAERLPPTQVKNDRGESVSVDLGRVGKIRRVKPELIDNLISTGFVPVIAPIACDKDGKTLNINADSAAGEIAQSLRAAKLVLMTDVEGVRGADNQMLRSLQAEEAEQLIEKNVIRAGMIPKVRCALDAVRNGVEKVHIIDGRAKHALLLEIFTDQGVGTEIHRDGAA